MTIYWRIVGLGLIFGSAKWLALFVWLNEQVIVFCSIIKSVNYFGMGMKL